MGLTPGKVREALMALLQFRRKDAGAPQPVDIGDMLDGFSIEVMPRTAEKVDDFPAILPTGTRVYIAHIDGSPIEDMVTTAKRLSRDGFAVMPHFPARSIPDAATLKDWIARYQGEAGITEGLILAGSLTAPRGDFSSSIELLETGLFSDAGFTRLHVAGHPEGNRDIDPDGGDAAVMQALNWKQAFSEGTDADMAIITQFAFDTGPMIAWAKRIRSQGITLPIHLGIAGPAKLQTLIKFAIACGVGPSLKILQKRALDVTKLVLPYEPTDLVAELAQAKANDPEFPIDRLHIFPLGGIKTSADWADTHGAKDPA